MIRNPTWDKPRAGEDSKAVELWAVCAVEDIAMRRGHTCHRRQRS